jgi:[glutamine synthetase] adenylyltransferase / [glutamine synthetase]-adenylyl-L-tyrosine phosphorylase
MLEKEIDEKIALFFKACEKCKINLPFSPDFIKKLKKAFTASEFVFKSLLKTPFLLNEIINLKKINSNDLSAFYLKNLSEIFSISKSKDELLSDLRIFRNKEMLKIAWMDITKSDLFYTIKSLSILADAFLESISNNLYDDFCRKHGTPLNKNGEKQKLVIIAMGKLGGCELNFSSDIDIMFAYPEDGKTEKSNAEPDYDQIYNQEFFTKLCRELIYTINTVTYNGFIFRVDLRLRPYGDAGAIVMSFDGMEEYYKTQGREWERYAFIKARIAAGDKEAGGALLLKLKPFVYRRYLDFGTMEALRDMKNKISKEVIKKELICNIKLGKGGIREIEFFGQMFQLIRGGVEPMLQEKSILKMLNILNEKNYISEKIHAELKNAYIFLRNTENRLQEFADSQVHSLFKDQSKMIRIAISMGFSCYEDFISELNLHRENVHNHFNSVLRIENEECNKKSQEKEDVKGVWQDASNYQIGYEIEYELDYEKAKKIIYDTGFKEPDKILELVIDLKNDKSGQKLNKEGKNRLEKLIPQILIKASASDAPFVVLERIFNLIKEIQRRICYFSLLLENPSAVELLVKFAEKSSGIMSFLSKHPMLLDGLLDQKKLYEIYKKEDLKNDIDQRLAIIEPDDVEYQMEDLRIFKQAHSLKIAASDIIEKFSLNQVSEQLTYLSEIIINKALDLIFEHLVKKHGKPSCKLNGKECKKGFAVIAYGKLGGIELGYGSDLDLIFLHTAEAGGMTDGKLPIDNTTFFARLAQRFLHFLTSHTSAGILYKVDMRLRPSGASGLLVSNINSFYEYQKSEAWTWEHQAVIRARAILGDDQIIKKFNKIRQKILCGMRHRKKLSKDIIKMRLKMKNERIYKDKSLFDLKQGDGGIVDIEFLVQYLTLLNAAKYRKIIKWTNTINIIESLAEYGIIDDITANLLKKAYISYRHTSNRLYLNDKKAVISDDNFRSMRTSVIKAWEYYLE